MMLAQICERVRLDSSPIFGHHRRCGPIAQLGERFNGIEEVKGSSPFRSKVIDHSHPTLPGVGFWLPTVVGYHGTTIHEIIPKDGCFERISHNLRRSQ